MRGTRKSFIAFAVFTITATFLACLVTYQLVFRGCLFWTCAPARTFSVLELGIPVRLFPDGAVVNEPVQPSELLGAVEASNMTVYWNRGTGLAVYDVERFGSERKALNVYQAITDDVLVFADHHPLNFKSDLADNYSLVCGPSEFGGYRCWYISRYAEYVLSFNATIGEKLSFEQFEDIVRYIDEQMEARLNSE